MSIFGFLINLFVLEQLFAVGWIGLVVRVLFATCTSSIMHLIFPPKFCITFVFPFSWVLQPFQEKLKTMLMQNFGGTTKGRITPFFKKAYWEKRFWLFCWSTCSTIPAEGNVRSPDSKHRVSSAEAPFSQFCAWEIYFLPDRNLIPRISNMRKTCWYNPLSPYPASSSAAKTNFLSSQFFICQFYSA